MSQQADGGLSGLRIILMNVTNWENSTDFFYLGYHTSRSWCQVVKDEESGEKKLSFF